MKKYLTIHKSSEAKYVTPQVRILHLQIEQNILAEASGSAELPDISDGGDAI